MLTELYVANVAIIEQQSISLSSGLNVFSGETGSGKSVILQSLELILGGKARTQLIRAGMPSAEVQAVFDLTLLEPAIRQSLPDIVDGDELVVVRSISRDGRSKVYINGRLGTVTLLKEVAGKLINICGQGQHLQLLDPTYHLEVLDRFAGNENLLASYKRAWHTWRKESAEVARLEAGAARSAARQEELEQIVSELEAIEIKIGLRSELEEAVHRLSNMEGLVAAGQEALQLLEEDAGLWTRLQRLGSCIEKLKELDATVQDLSSGMQAAQVELRELERSLEHYVDSLDLDGEQLEQLRERLAELARLERLHRTNDAGLVKLLENCRLELCELSSLNALPEARQRLQQAKCELNSACSVLTTAREGAGERFCLMVKEELSELNMPGVLLHANWICTEPSPMGAEQLELLFSANAGETPRPLVEIASGGELSRVMLVLKKVLRERTGVNVLVFDEVDTGISGSTARAVGMKLKQLASYSQVLCITHLAQVASLADRHFLVEKHSGQRTVAIIRHLEGASQIDEIARMLAGYTITAAARESARELLSSK